jgi:excisionase family DNA binding protein
MKIDSEKLLTVTQAAAMLGISKQAIERAYREHRIKEVRIGGRVFIPLEQVNAYQADPAMIKIGKRRARISNK